MSYFKDDKKDQNISHEKREISHEKEIKDDNKSFSSNFNSNNSNEKEKLNHLNFESQEQYHEYLLSNFYNNNLNNQNEMFYLQNMNNINALNGMCINGMSLNPMNAYNLGIQQNLFHNNFLFNKINMGMNYMSNMNNESGPYLYSTNKNTYSLDFQLSNTSDRIALGSLDFNLFNSIEILSIHNEQLFTECTEFHQLPISKLQWCPYESKNDLLGVTSDILRIYKYDDQEFKLKLKAELLNKKSKYSDPLTSFDWNKVNESIIGTASLDTTCTIWDINKETIKTQLIAHDSEVLDIAFSRSEENIFISTGADGSIRQFDLRCLEHSTILYECKQKSPFIRVSWNSKNKDQFAAISDNKKNIYVINIPSTDKKKKELNAHSSVVNAFSWSPIDQNVICTVGEDGYAYIWDLNSNETDSQGLIGPYLQYNAGKAIRNVSWSKSNPKWIGIVYDNKLKLLNL